MQTYSLENQPDGIGGYRKTATIGAAFIKEPFIVETGEGPMTISPETTDDWEGGYFIAYPSDGSKPYAISPKFMRSSYETIR